MANTFKVSNITEHLSAKVVSEMPIIANSTKYDKIGQAGDGQTFNVAIPDPSVVYDGINTSAISGETKETSFPLTFVNKGIKATMTEVERTLDVGDFENQIVKLRSANLAHSIEAVAANKLCLKADGAVVVSAASYNALSDAIAALEQAKVGEALIGAVAPVAKNKIIQSGFQFFNTSNAYKEKSWVKGLIGEYANAMWYSSPDIADIVTGTYTPAASATVGAITAEGSTTLTITDGGVTSATTFKAGQVLNIAGVYTVDMLNGGTAELASFIAQADGVATAGQMVVTVKPIYFTGSGKNVSVASIAGGTKVTSPLEASTRYNRGFVWTESALAFQPAKYPKDFAGATRSEFNFDGKLVMTQTGYSNGDALQSYIRWDVLFACDVPYTRMVRVIYFKA